MTEAIGPLTWAQVDAAVKAGGTSVYDWCWVCGLPLGPDKMHVLIDNGRVTRHTYCCRKHRYVVVDVPHPHENAGCTMVQQRTDLEVESLAMAFRSGELKAGWE